MAERFFCPDATPDPGGCLTLEGDEAHHLGRVRRIGVGQVVEVFDGRGFATRAEVVAVGRTRVELRPVGSPLPEQEPPVRLTLATGVPKGDRFDWLVEKATELGVERLVPVLSERSVVRPAPAKIARLRRTVIEASKQCGRSRLMLLDDPLPWPVMLTSFAHEPLRLLADPGGGASVHWPPVGHERRAVVAIGPEGGLTDAEAAGAIEAGWLPVSLGPFVLRVETAALAAAARIAALSGSANRDA